ncbi:predicted protein [Histoplasma capsulatum var. duboisii H88]|uniref:Predicted protein n=1 Tax=Ajellomyces capsulatus (strain H88) TaxID=544711 RepID=F0UJY5_AJEC8|nr:predicted protein [Histoplasma capsulatum var. duboisii H88]
MEGWLAEGEREREGGAKSKAKPSGYFGRGWKTPEKQRTPRIGKVTSATVGLVPARQRVEEGGGATAGDGDGDGDAIDVRATAWGVEAEAEVEVDAVEISGLACWRVWAMGVAGSGDKRSAKTSGHESVTSGLGSGPDKATQARNEGTRKEGWRLE